MSLHFTQQHTTTPPATQRPANPRGESFQQFTPAFPSDLAMTMSGANGGYGSQPGSRRPSMHGGHPGLVHPFPVSLSRRSSLASGPRPLTKAEFSGPNTPSLLSRAGSPVQPLASEGTRSRQNSFSGRDKRQGQFIGSLDCGTTYVFHLMALMADPHGLSYSTSRPKSSASIRPSFLRYFLMRAGTNRTRSSSSSA